MKKYLKPQIQVIKCEDLCGTTWQGHSGYTHGTPSKYNNFTFDENVGESVNKELKAHKSKVHNNYGWYSEDGYGTEYDDDGNAIPFT